MLNGEKIANQRRMILMSPKKPAEQATRANESAIQAVVQPPSESPS
jgi:hypothetical protein